MLLKMFQLCFGVGAIFAVVSFVLGQLIDFIDFDVDADAPTEGINGGISPFKPVIIAAFLTVFGGMGIIGLNYMRLGTAISLTAALASALLVSFLMFRYILVPLYKAQTSAVSQQDLIGSPATVKLAMRSNDVGRIAYAVNGNTYTAPAVSADGDELPAGSRVVIVDIEKNLFKVTKI